MSLGDNDESRRMSFRLLLLAFVSGSALFWAQASACVNPGKDLVVTEVLFDPVTIPQFLFDAKWENSRIAEVIDLVAYRSRDWKALEKALVGASSEDPRFVDARAEVLMRLSRSQEAVRFLEAFEEKRPGRYETAANLGTAYELSGDLVNARRWISEGITRNPESHEGTEWLHVRILDARLALTQNPDWMRSHSITGLDFGGKRKPDFSRVKGDIKPTIRALEYQLRERITFVAPPDAVVGDMVYDLAHLSSREGSARHTIALLHLAKLYNPAMPRPLEERLAYFQSQIPSTVEGTDRPTSSEPKERVIRKQFVIKHASASDLRTHLVRLVPKATPRLRGRHKITVHGSPEVVREAEHLLRILDQPVP